MSKAEKFIQDHTNHFSYELVLGIYHDWLTPDQARRAVEIAREELIEKVVEWLLKNDSYAKPTEVLVRDLEQAMKDE